MHDLMVEDKATNYVDDGFWADQFVQVIQRLFVFEGEKTYLQFLIQTR